MPLQLLRLALSSAFRMFVSNNGAITCHSGIDDNVYKNITIFIGTTVFLSNIRTGSGSTLDIHYIYIELQASSFINNSHAVYTSGCTAFFSNTHFLKNNAGAISQAYSHLNISHCLFKSNSGIMAGAIYANFQKSLFITGTKFLDNFANESGGAIYTTKLADVDSCQFKNNYAARSGGAVYFYHVEEESPPHRLSNSSFYLNKAGSNGGAIYCLSYEFTTDLPLIDGNATINSAMNGGFLYSAGCTVSFKGTYYIIGNNATNGGAVFITRVSIVEMNLANQVLFMNNTAENFGGAIYAVNSEICINSSFVDQVIFSHNAAARKGGALYIPDDLCESVLSVTTGCSITFFGEEHVLFSNNTSKYGPILYGGLLDRC